MAKKAYVRNSDNTAWVELASATTDLSNYAPLIPATQTGFRNKIINGDFRIDQRNAGALKNNNSVSTALATSFGADRWIVHADSTNTVFSQRYSDGTGSGKYYLLATQGNLTRIFIAQRVESLNSYDLAGKTVTLSFSVAAGNFTSLTWTASYANTTDSFGTFATPTKTQIATGNVTVGSTFSSKSITFDVPLEATTGIEILFSTPLVFTPVLKLSQVQLELGSVATPFEQRPIGTELALCQRYYWRSENDSYFGNVVSAGIFDFRVDLPVEMRVRPVTNNNISSIILTIGVGATQVNVYNGAFTTAPTTYGGGVTISSKKGGVIRFSGGAGGTNGFAGRLLCGTSVYFDFDAEL